MNKLKFLLIAVCCIALSSKTQSAEIDRINRELHDLNISLQEIRDILPPIGSIIEYSGNNPPNANYWLECNGQAVNRNQYPQLLLEIGVTYGVGDGLNTFNIPDRLGRVAVGIDSNNSTGGRVTTAPNIVLGGTFGAETHTLNITEMPAHDHQIYGCQGGSNPGCNTSFDPTNVPRQSSSTGGNQPHNNMQPSIFMKFYIRAK